MSATILGPDGLSRCRWCAAAPEFMAYHDTEWGFPVDDDNRLFEKLCLEGFQSGLSWRTILAKRQNFRVAFHDFDFDRIAAFTDADAERLMNDKGIVRHRGKILAVINTAELAVAQTASTSAASHALSKDLKRRGWSFVGPTTVYAFMQAMGLVNDHVEECIIRDKVAQARLAFQPPK
jgi:DNA-3-methyladenine glycosylase I